MSDDQDVRDAVDLPLHGAAGLGVDDGADEVQVFELVGLDVNDEDRGAELVGGLSGGGEVGAFDVVLGHERHGALAVDFGFFGAGVGVFGDGEESPDALDGLFGCGGGHRLVVPFLGWCERFCLRELGGLARAHLWIFRILARSFRFRNNH